MMPMRLLGAIAALGLLVASARADTAKTYAGQIVISPDPTPTAAGELAAYLAANAVKGGHYELIKGPPWEVHLVGVLAKDPGARPVTLIVTDASDAKAAPLLTTELTATRRIVIASTTATIAAGFAANKTYALRLVLGKTVLAKAELRLRE